MTKISITGGIPLSEVCRAYNKPKLPTADEIFNEWYGIEE